MSSGDWVEKEVTTLSISFKSPRTACLHQDIQTMANMDGKQTMACMEEHWCLWGQGMTQQDISGNYKSTCPNSPQLLVAQLRITVC